MIFSFHLHFRESTIFTKRHPEQYDVRLTIKPISANVAKLESITLIPKKQKMKQW